MTRKHSPGRKATPVSERLPRESDPPELTDAEIDELLERFDQTEPKLQRRIIAKFVTDRTILLDALKALLAECDPQRAEDPETGWFLDVSTEGKERARAAINFAEKGAAS